MDVIDAQWISFGDMESDVEESSVDCMAIHGSGTCRLERPATGRIWRIARPLRGDIAIAPAHTDRRFRNHGAAEVLKISLPADWRSAVGPGRAGQFAPATGIRDALLSELLMVIGRLVRAGVKPHDPYRAALSEAVIQHLRARHLGDRSEPPLGLSQAQRNRALAFLESRIGADFVLADLARELNLSPSYTSAQFKVSFGRGPHAFFAALRMEAACRLLRTSAKTANQIAEELGFSSPTYFGVVFRNCYGTTPTVFRRKAS